MIVVVAIFAVLLIMGVPICFVLGITGVAHVASLGTEQYFNIIVQKMFGGMSVSALVCIPFFIVAGELMNAGGVTERLLAFIRSLVGHYRGGLAYVVVVVAVILSAILGSANAVAAILCAVVVPEMIRDKYPDSFSAGLVCASGVLGPVIPPSVTFVYFSVLSGVSVNAMFMGGAIPGILIALAYITVIAVQTRRLNLPRSTDGFALKTTLVTFVKALPALVVPVVLVGGITSGMFTPAESGAVAVFAAIVASIVYGNFRPSFLPKVLMRSTTVTAGIFIIIGFGNIMGWTMAIDNIPNKVKDAVLSMTQSGFVIILLMFVILIIVGCAMEATAAMLIFTPVMMPLGIAAGMHPVQFGVWFSIMLTIALVTPPVGMTLFVTSNITKIPLERISKSLIPFIAAALLITLLVGVFREPALILPRLLGIV
ncbi:MAG: TRAP transporter large permease [Clostridiales Family XIII bacterium]|jgi:tripartite ATP-independent transporter DctM subunit|nr:TRAP transporter large permease [Clostridiales Family XIII bacterium]